MKKSICCLAGLILFACCNFAQAIDKANVGPITCLASQVTIETNINTLESVRLLDKYKADVKLGREYLDKDCDVDTDKLLAAMLPFVKYHLYKDCRDPLSGGGRCCYIDPDQDYKLICTPFM